jgi:hypothetical protein
MSSKGKGDAGEYEFTRAAYDELRDAEKMYEVQFVLSLEPTGQRGVWALSVVAVSNDGSDGLAYIAKWAGTWPNSMVVSYGAFLYQACHRCCRMVEAWHKSKQDEARPEEAGG